MFTCSQITAYIAIISLLTAFAQKPARTPYFSATADEFSATGYWTSANSNEKPTPHEVQIDCFRAQGLCVVATAESLFSGQPHVSVSYFQVRQWDKDILIASDSTGECITQTFAVSFEEHTVKRSGAMKRVSADLKHACKFFGAEAFEERFITKNSAEYCARQHCPGDPVTSNKPIFH